MKLSKVWLGLMIVLLLGASQELSAVVTIQVYSPQGTAGSFGPDQDTWFVTDNPFDIYLAAAFGGSTDPPLKHVGLLFSAPEGDTGTITISGDGLAGPIVISTMYDTKAQLEAIYPQSGVDPLDFSGLNNHYPLKDDVSDFLFIELGNFYDLGESIPDYNADGGINYNTNATGDQREYQIALSGFSTLHIDGLGFAENQTGKKWIGSWELNPGSHDTTHVPAPGALFLGSLGIGLVGWFRRRKTI